MKFSYPNNIPKNNLEAYLLNKTPVINRITASNFISSLFHTSLKLAYSNCEQNFTTIPVNRVSQTVVRGPQVVLRFCPCGPLRLNISQKKTEKIKLT
jgi:hypothetical protein